ncbi:DUF4097 family beta strand repeat-containing protein [Ekhidna sp.]|uniref:DUF4097 family beta strand repeat-containing protein n=1 Tax=Ekhidna sp. TaxID=2608089 RepID=UPI003B504CF2
MNGLKGLTILLCLATFGLSAQPKKVTESVTVTGQEMLDLEFAFADDITFKTWDKNEVFVEVMVEINNGEDNDIFTLNSSKSTNTIYIEMDEDMWKKISKEKNGKWDNCSYSSTINYTVYLPKNLDVRAETISGDFAFEYFGSEMNLKTISGDIDATIPERKGMDFKAKTISGEIYSDIKIEYPYGKEGLRQIVGQDVRGRVSDGGVESSFETISGNIYLRKG